MADSLIAKFGYVGIILVLVLGGLGLPVPEEAPVILAAVLSRQGRMVWPLAVGACFVGVLAGDFVVYALGYFHGEKVLQFPITRRFLSREREAQIKGYFHRHGFRILITGRFVPGFRTAAYLTAGILRLPPLKLLFADLCAATLSTGLLFSLGYFCTKYIESGWKQTQGYVVVGVGLAIAGYFLYRHYKAQKRGGAAVGPPVPVSDEVPVPIDDLRSGFLKRESASSLIAPPPILAPAADVPPAVIQTDTASIASEPIASPLGVAEPVEIVSPVPGGEA